MDRPDPWKPLTRIGWVSLLLGMLYLIRYWNPYPTILLDFPSMCVSFLAGWALLRRLDTALVTTAVAAGVILADALISILTMGPELIHELARNQDFADNPYDTMRLAQTIPLILVYGFEAAFWPYAAAVVLRDFRKRGLPAAYVEHSRATVIGAFIIPGWISLVLHLWIKVIAFRLV